MIGRLVRFRLVPAVLAAILPVCAKAEEFSFERLRDLARRLAGEPHREPDHELDAFWRNLTYDQHRDIRFRTDQGLWAGSDLPFSIDFFHPGWTAKKTVEIFAVEGGEAVLQPFDRSLFDYGKNEIPNGIPAPPGYAGWRARHPINRPDHMDEFLVFLGASYFRAIPAHAPYGLSGRGLSLNSGLPGVPEEFPDFTKFWIRKPEPGDPALTVWALLEGPTVTGAYQFRVTPGAETVMDVEAEITLRGLVQQLGLVPFSSMFWFGKMTHPRPLDFRPEVHDSDCLLMELEGGARHLRPIDHTPGRFRHCVFVLERPKSWSILQRERDFTAYQDVEADYHRRPGVRVEPVSGFGKGNLHLIEMPTPDETNDNVIVLWEPVPEPQPGTPFAFRYRLVWMPDAPPVPQFCVKATRVGHPVQKPDQLLFTIDFAKPLRPEPKEGERKWDDLTGVKPVVTIHRDDVRLIHAGITDLSMAHVDALPLGLGRRDDIHMPQVVRAFFVIEPPPGTDQLDLTCELQDAEGKPVSERWVYLWQKP